MFSPVFLTISSVGVTGEGMKNLGLEPETGLADGIEGDWNKFTGLPRLLLNVSTYLK